MVSNFLLKSPVFETRLQALCKIYQIDPKWVKAIITTESNWNQYAVRYEANYSYIFNPSRFTNTEISMSTEIATQKMSWGLCQIMGGLAREQGHTGLMAELVNPDVNIKHLCVRLCHLKKISENEDDIFSMYNGGPGELNQKVNGIYFNQTYVDKVKANLI